MCELNRIARKCRRSWPAIMLPDHRGCISSPKFRRDSLRERERCWREEEPPQSGVGFLGVVDDEKISRAEKGSCSSVREERKTKNAAETPLVIISFYGPLFLPKLIAPHNSPPRPSEKLSIYRYRDLPW